MLTKPNCPFIIAHLLVSSLWLFIGRREDNAQLAELIFTKLLDLIKLYFIFIPFEAASFSLDYTHFKDSFFVVIALQLFIGISISNILLMNLTAHTMKKMTMNPILTFWSSN